MTSDIQKRAEAERRERPSSLGAIKRAEAARNAAFGAVPFTCVYGDDFAAVQESIYGFVFTAFTSENNIFIFIRDDNAQQEIFDTARAPSQLFVMADFSYSEDLELQRLNAQVVSATTIEHIPLLQLTRDVG